MNRFIPLFMLLATSFDAGACSFPQYMMLPPVMPWDVKEGHQKLEVPKFEYEVHRGKLRENNDSCADTGVLTFTIRANEYSKAGTGYLIEILESTEDEIVLPDYPIMAQGIESTYSFPWLDGATTVQEPLKLLVRITQMSTDGKKSDPIIVEVVHYGYL